MKFVRICAVCAVVATTSFLPALALADRDGERWSKGDNDEEPWEHHNPGRGQQVPVVPEANAFWVLIPFLGAVLLLSARQIRSLRGDVLRAE